MFLSGHESKYFTSVAKVIIHEQFQRKKYSVGGQNSTYPMFDIALLKLPNKLRFGPQYRPVCLPGKMDMQAIAGKPKILFMPVYGS